MQTDKVRHSPLDCPCRGRHLSPEFRYNAPPAGEINFRFSAGGAYARDVLRCSVCGHFVSVHEMDDSALYSEEYVSSNYRDEEGIRRTFDRINALDPSRSDNAGRVRRLLEYAETHFASRPDRTKTVLDVGSGLCVFLYRMKQAGWECTALDPDARAVNHATHHVGVKGIRGDFRAATDIGRYDVITFNKVLEHVEDPVSMLAKGAEHLAPGGFVYVELPDGEAAAAEGSGREEFFIDHYHIFSLASTAMLARRAGFDAACIERLREPSTKFTIRAFLTAAHSQPFE